MEEPGWLQSTGLQRVRLNQLTNTQAPGVRTWTCLLGGHLSFLRRSGGKSPTLPRPAWLDQEALSWALDEEGDRWLSGWPPPPNAPAQTEEQVHRECPRGRDVMWRKTEPGSQHHPALKVPATSQPQLPAALMPASPRAFALAPLAWGLLVPDLHRWVRLHLNAISSDSSWSSLLDAPQQPPAHINNPNLCYES